MAEPRRARVLFVISQLVQGGAERWLYEVARALDPSKFAVELLTSPLVRGRRHTYLEPLRAAGIPIHQKLPVLNALLVRAAMSSGRLPEADRAVAWPTRIKLGRRWFRDYDLVCPVQIENYNVIRGCVDPRRAVIHLMSNAVQHEHDHLALLRDGRRYHLVLFNEAQREDLEGIAHEAFVWPLAMDLSNRPRLPIPADSRRIAVFTRLSRQKPLEPFLYALQALRRRVPDAELHVFGRGDPEIFGATLDLLQLRDAVRFRGHAPDMVAALRDERIAMCWMLSVDDAIGYASIELGSVGIPVLFWNLGCGSVGEVAALTGGAVQAFGDVAALSEATARHLEGPSHLQPDAERLRDHIFRRHQITDTVGALEAHYMAVLRASRTG